MTGGTGAPCELSAAVVRMTCVVSLLQSPLGWNSEGIFSRTRAATCCVYVQTSEPDRPRGPSDLIPPDGEAEPDGVAEQVDESVPAEEAVPGGEAMQVAEVVPVGEAISVGEAVPADEAVPAGEAVPVGVEIVTEGVGGGAVGEGVGGGLVVASPWIDGGEDCPTTARTRLGPRFW